MFKLSTAASTKLTLAIISCLIAVPANAAPAEDVFSVNTHGVQRVKALPPLQASAQLKHDAETPKIGAGAGAMMSADTPIVHWFEKYDEVIAKAKPTQTEQIILKRPLNDEIERVNLMTKTCVEIKNRYIATAKILRSLPVQENWPDVKELRNGQAEFYELEASVYDEMTKPRPASRTQEEFDARCKDLLDHAEAANEYGQALVSTDLNLRRTYGVHLARDKDSLAQYVMSTPKQGIYNIPK